MIGIHKLLGFQKRGLGIGRNGVFQNWSVPAEAWIVF
jgi:hypothetical protein